MAIGKVKWFNNAKGYGFIVEENGTEDLFAHYTSIDMEGYKTLKAGQTVYFDIIKGDKGFHAANIRSEEITSTEQASDPAKTKDKKNHLEIV